MLSMHLATVVSEMPVPKGLSVGRIEEHRIRIDDLGIRYQDKAHTTWYWAIKNATRLGITSEWTSKILEELKRYPEDRLKYPRIMNMKQVYQAEPIFSGPSPTAKPKAPEPSTQPQ